MTTQEIVALLIAERDKLNAAITVLAGEQKRRGRPPGRKTEPAQAGNFDYNAPNVPDWVKPASMRTPAKPKRKMSAAGRAAIVAALKKRWAAIRAGKAAAPSAGRKKAKRKAAA